MIVVLDDRNDEGSVRKIRSLRKIRYAIPPPPDTACSRRRTTGCLRAFSVHASQEPIEATLDRAQQTIHLVVGRRIARVKAQHRAILNIHPVQYERVYVNVQVQGGAEALDDLRTSESNRACFRAQGYSDELLAQQRRDREQQEAAEPPAKGPQDTEGALQALMDSDYAEFWTLPHVPDVPVSVLMSAKYDPACGKEGPANHWPVMRSTSGFAWNG